MHPRAQSQQVRAYPGLWSARRQQTTTTKEDWNVSLQLQDLGSVPKTNPEPGSHSVTAAGPWGPREAKAQPHGGFREVCVDSNYAKLEIGQY